MIDGILNLLLDDGTVLTVVGPEAGKEQGYCSLSCLYGEATKQQISFHLILGPDQWNQLKEFFGAGSVHEG